MVRYDLMIFRQGFWDTDRGDVDAIFAHVSGGVGDGVGDAFDAIFAHVGKDARGVCGTAFGNDVEGVRDAAFDDGARFARGACEVVSMLVMANKVGDVFVGNVGDVCETAFDDGARFAEGACGAAFGNEDRFVEIVLIGDASKNVRDVCDAAFDSDDCFVGVVSTQAIANRDS